MPLVCNVSLNKKAKQKGNATAPPAKTINSRSERILSGMKGGEMLERRKRNSVVRGRRRYQAGQASSFASEMLAKETSGDPLRRDQHSVDMECLSRCLAGAGIYSCPVSPTTSEPVVLWSSFRVKVPRLSPLCARSILAKWQRHPRYSWR